MRRGLNHGINIRQHGKRTVPFMRNSSFVVRDFVVELVRKEEIPMSLFKKKNKDIPLISMEESVPVLRCSICTGEQVLCSKDRKTGQLTELMLIRKPSDLFEFCEANEISADDVQKIY